MKNIRLPGFHKLGIARDQKGITLIEVIITIAMTAIIVAGVLMVIGTSTKILVMTKNQETAKDIAASEIEYIRSVPYADSYNLPALPDADSNFTIISSTSTPPYTVYATPIQLGEQEIEIDVFVKGSASAIYKLVDYRTNF